MRTLSLISAVLAVTSVFGQHAPTVYKNLVVKKYYDVGGCPGTFIDPATGKPRDVSKMAYQINGIEVSKEAFEKYQVNKENIHCCPCILQQYDEFDRLVEEGVSCQGGGVGWFKDYYSNGKIRIEGFYKENPDNDWEYRADHNFCNIMDGKWICYDSKGKELYSEYWDNGYFVKQVPELTYNQMWWAEELIDGKPRGHLDFVVRDRISKVTIKPHFKNSAPLKDDMKITLSIGVKDGREVPPKTFIIKDDSELRLTDLIHQAGFNLEEARWLGVRVTSADSQMLGISYGLE